MDTNKLLEALKVGIKVSYFDGNYNIFSGDELYITYYQNEYCLGVKSRGGYLKASDYGNTWTLLRPEDVGADNDTLHKDLVMEMFN